MALPWRGKGCVLIDNNFTVASDGLYGSRENILQVAVRHDKVWRNQVTNGFRHSFARRGYDHSLCHSILSIECADNMTDDKNAELIDLLDIVRVPTGSEGSSVSLYLYVVSRDIRKDVCIVPK